MKFELLERLAISASSVNDVPVEGLGKLYRQTENVDAADQAVSETFLTVCGMVKKDENPPLREALNELDSEIGAQCWAHEEQGFINGFRLGVLLTREVQQ